MIWIFRKDGYLFDKEAILQYIITKKTDYAKKLKEYERQKQLEENETSEANALEEQKKLLRFINTEKNIVTAGLYSRRCIWFWFSIKLFSNGKPFDLQLHRAQAQAFPIWPMEKIKFCRAFGYRHKLRLPKKPNSKNQIQPFSVPFHRNQSEQRIWSMWNSPWSKIQTTKNHWLSKKIGTCARSHMIF